MSVYIVIELPTAHAHSFASSVNAASCAKIKLKKDRCLDIFRLTQRFQFAIFFKIFGYVDGTRVKLIFIIIVQTPLLVTYHFIFLVGIF